MTPNVTAWSQCEGFMNEDFLCYEQTACDHAASSVTSSSQVTRCVPVWYLTEIAQAREGASEEELLKVSESFPQDLNDVNPLWSVMGSILTSPEGMQLGYDTPLNELEGEVPLG